MKNILILLVLCCCAAVLFSEGQSESTQGRTHTAAEPGLSALAAKSAAVFSGGAGIMSAVPGDEAILEGDFAMIETNYSVDRQYPSLSMADGTMVRLEGDISRQLAYGSRGKHIAVKGYFFSIGFPMRFVVTELINLAARE
ncbi:hypothetical protein [Marispirochaeta aestuarii]|uniref:hypothetical protein n=1 Tax=Marispirochaeta aestuarii TaxID=1963862 RepID=UPI0029C6D71D|nr:hypothetical protein [Marispirochaeta aestuarii]